MYKLLLLSVRPLILRHGHHNVLRTSYGLQCLVKPQPFHSFSSTISAVLLPPAVFAGLLVTLWTWKCLMLVVFQSSIIYMPFLPPFARKERISDYINQCSGIKWREEQVQAEGAKIKLCIGETECIDTRAAPSGGQVSTVYILYFQGNAGSIPMRLPSLSSVMKSLKTLKNNDLVRYTMVCLSYRGYWKSQRKRPSENGLAKDSAATLNWVKRNGSSKTTSVRNKIQVVFWGQSLGCGVAMKCAAQHFPSEQLDLRAIILETPFTSVKDMLVALYPQKWLPYRYLHPFLWNHFNGCDALGRLSYKSQRPDIVILQAEKDELVPRGHGEVLEKHCQKVGLPVTRKVIKNCLHTDVMLRLEGREAVIEALRRVVGSNININIK